MKKMVLILLLSFSSSLLAKSNLTEERKAFFNLKDALTYIMGDFREHRCGVSIDEQRKTEAYKMRGMAEITSKGLDEFSDQTHKDLGRVLGSSYKVRPIRGDGNCFYTSFITNILHQRATGQISGKVKTDLMNKLLQYSDKILATGDEEAILGQQEFLDLFYDVREFPLFWERNLRDEVKMKKMIKYIRVLSAKLIEENIPDKDTPVAIVRGDVLTRDQLINNSVLVMGVVAEAPVGAALAAKLNINIEISDTTLPKTDANWGKLLNPFQDSEKKDAQKATVRLLQLQDHYESIEKK